MLIGGLQKMTLLDFPGKVACIVFTKGCNFQCPYCHNSELIEFGEGAYTDQDIWKYLEKRAKMLEGVCITGGEPLLQPDIEAFIRGIKIRGMAVKLDTNGSNPEMLEKLISGNLLDYVAMDVKNSPDKYKLTTNSDVDIRLIDESIKILLKGKVEYEFRTTVVKEFHQVEDFLKIGQWIEGAEKYCIQEYKDSQEVLVEGLSSPGTELIQKFSETISPYVKQIEIR